MIVQIFTCVIVVLCYFSLSCCEKGRTIKIMGKRFDLPLNFKKLIKYILRVKFIFVVIFEAKFISLI